MQNRTYRKYQGRVRDIQIYERGGGGGGGMGIGEFF